MRVTCRTCGNERTLGYAAVWAIRHGFNSGDCNACACAKRARHLTARLTDKVDYDPQSGCWNWTAGRDKRGYARLTIDGRSRLAHRLSYEEFMGPVPEGLELDHLCRNPRCINPEHLEPVTHAENMRRAAEADRTDHCPSGHLFDEANTYLDKNGYRKCRACNRERSRGAYHARKSVCT